MSAITGVFRADGRPAGPGAVRIMLQAMVHRGPDGSASWHEGPVGLGHALLRTTRPDSSLLAAGGLAITTDCRLDNRDELIAALRLDGRPSDAAIILAAWRRWREDCPAHLLGDFAFAIWDSHDHRLFCARDHFGVKPFYLHAGETGFIFASEIKALLAAGVSRATDETRIADFIAALAGDSRSTFYRAIERLPPGHTLTISPFGRQLRRYWSLPSGDGQPHGDLPGAFRSIFREAVATRLDGAGRVGAMLSGGLDSSSIAAVAGTILADSGSAPLPTVSLVFDRQPRFSERQHIEAVLACGEYEPSFASSDGFAGFGGSFRRILAMQDEPFLAPGLAVSQEIYTLAARRGIRVLLDGHGGDEVVSHGHGRLPELARDARWITLWREAQGLAATYGGPAWPVFASYAGRYGPGRHIARLMQPKRSSSTGGPDTGRPGWLRYVDPAFAARTDLRARLAAHAHEEAAAARAERTRHTWFLSTGMVPHAFEVLDRSAAHAGIEPRYPFWDKRLVEFCIGLPSEAKLAGGWSRLVLRRAMAGILPSSIQWRRDKLDFAPHVVRGIADSESVRDALAHAAGAVAAYVDLTAIRQAYDRIVARGEAADGHDVQAVWRAMTLAVWLDQTAVQESAGRHAVAL